MDGHSFKNGNMIGEAGRDITETFVVNGVQEVSVQGDVSNVDTSAIRDGANVKVLSTKSGVPENSACITDARRVDGEMAEVDEVAKAGSNQDLLAVRIIIFAFS